MLRIAILFIAISSLSSCYSFRGTSIPPDVKSYFVEQTTLSENAKLAPGEMPELFMEALRAKIRNQSRLVYNDRTPDIEFRSVITDFRADDEAIGAGDNLSTLLKLTASVRVEYVDLADEDAGWTQVFSHTVNFEPTVDLQTAQEGFVAEILEQITEQVFNKAFTNW